MRPASSHMLRRSTADCTVFLGWDSTPALSAACNDHDVFTGTGPGLSLILFGGVSGIRVWVSQTGRQIKR